MYLFERVVIYDVDHIILINGNIVHNRSNFFFGLLKFATCVIPKSYKYGRGQTRFTDYKLVIVGMSRRRAASRVISKKSLLLPSKKNTRKRLFLFSS